MEKWESNITTFELERKFNSFMCEHSDKISDNLKEMLNDSFVSGVGQYYYPTEFFQLYDYFGAIPDRLNHYVYCMNQIKRLFNIKRNILEIGAGMCPTFAYRVASEQKKLDIGTISIYDPKILFKETNKYNNLKIYKEEFNSDINIKDYDLVVGIMPCSATDEMIKSIANYRKDFYILFCGCSEYNEYYDEYFAPEYYRQIRELEYICSDCNLGKLAIKYLPDRYKIEYPIVYNKRKI